MAAVKNARDVRNGWGVNGGPTDINMARALGFIGTRWVRMQVDNNPASGIQTLQNNLVTAGVADPNLRVNLLLNDYIQNAAANSWNNQQGWILNSVNPIKGPNGRSVLWAIEGPNEINSADGGGARDPNGTQLSVSADQNLVIWAQLVKTMKNNNAAALANVELCSGTVLYYNASNWSSGLNVAQYCDSASIHYYSGINGTNGCPSFPPNPDNFGNYYGFAQAGLGTASLIQTEGGFSSQINGGYGQDGRSSARYQIIQILDHHARGGHRYLMYNIKNNPVNRDGSTNRPGTPGDWNEDNFGQYWGEWTPKPVATALHNFANINSLNLNYNDPLNFTDTGAFSPTFNTSGLNVTGMTDGGTVAGGLMCLHKSDATTVVWVWNEPAIDNGSGTSLNVAPNNVIVNLGSTQTYKVYDVMGGGNVNAFNVSTNAVTNPIAQGTGASISLTLFGNPLAIVFGTPSNPPPPPPPPPPGVESLSGTTVTTEGPSINASPVPGVAGTGNILTIQGGQVALNSIVFTQTGGVVELYYNNHTAYQFNGSDWYGPITTTSTGDAPIPDPRVGINPLPTTLTVPTVGTVSNKSPVSTSPGHVKYTTT